MTAISFTEKGLQTVSLGALMCEF